MKMKMFWGKHEALKVKKRQAATVQVRMRVIAVIQNMHKCQLKKIAAKEVEGMLAQALRSIRLCLILLTLVKTNRGFN